MVLQHSLQPLLTPQNELLHQTYSLRRFYYQLFFQSHFICFFVFETKKGKAYFFDEKTFSRAGLSLKSIYTRKIQIILLFEADKKIIYFSPSESR